MCFYFYRIKLTKTKKENITRILLSTYMYDSQLSIGTVVLLWLVVFVQPRGNEGATVAALRKQHRGHGCHIQLNLKEKILHYSTMWRWGSHCRHSEKAAQRTRLSHSVQPEIKILRYSTTWRWGRHCRRSEKAAQRTRLFHSVQPKRKILCYPTTWRWGRHCRRSEKAAPRTRLSHSVQPERKILRYSATWHWGRHCRRSEKATPSNYYCTSIR